MFQFLGPCFVTYAANIETRFAVLGTFLRLFSGD